MYNPIHARAILLFMLVFAGCDRTARVAQIPSPSLPLGSGLAEERIAPQPASLPEPEYVKTELYFGLGKDNAGQISAQEWQGFLNNKITPAFKQGLTVVDAYGQYYNKAGTITSENSKMVILIHRPTPESNRAIEALIADYKREFHQESVLRTTAPVKVVVKNERL